MLKILLGPTKLAMRGRFKMPNPAAFSRQLRDMEALSDDLPRLLRNIAGCAESLRWSPADRQLLSGLLWPSAEHAATSDSIYRNAILRSLSGQRMPPEQVRCTPEHDQLITDDYHWPIDKIVNLALLSNTAPDKSVALVTSVRNEGLGLLEWVAYHLVDKNTHLSPV